MRYVTMWVEVDGYRILLNITQPMQEALSTLVEQGEAKGKAQIAHYQADYEEMRLKYVRLLREWEELQERSTEVPVKPRRWWHRA